MHKSLLAVIVGCALALPAAGQILSSVEVLEQRLPEVSFNEAPLELVMDWVAEVTQLNISTRWTVLDGQGIARDKPVSIRAKNLTVGQILWMILSEAGNDVTLAYRLSGGLLVLSTAEDLGKETLVKVYNVNDLLARVPRFDNAPRIDLEQQTQNFGSGGGGGGGQGVFGGGSGGGSQDDEEDEDELDQEIEELIEIIQQTIDPDSWLETGSGKGTIRAFRGQLIVNNNIDVHQKLGGAIEE